MKRNHFQPAMLAYNVICWLMLFNRDEEVKVETLQAHDAGGLALVLSVPGSQNLASCRINRRA